MFGSHIVNTHIVNKEKIGVRYAHILREQQGDRLLADYDVTFAPEEERV